MKKFIVLLFICIISFFSAVAVTNLIITISIPEAKYTNMVNVASNQNFLSVESYLSNVISNDIEGQRLSTLITLWQNATFIQQENALNALKN